MAKTKSQKKGFWKGFWIALVALVVGGCLSFGVVKLVDHYKTNDTEQTEQTPEEIQGGTETTPEEEIATEATANI